MTLAASLSTTSTTSAAVPGWDYLTHFGGGRTGAVGMQVVHDEGQSGDFEVRLEAKAPKAKDTQWGRVATVTQDEVNAPVVFTIAIGMEYRFRHVSGAGVIAYLV